MSEPKFTLFVSNLLGYGFSFIVLMMFLRNIIPFPMMYAPPIIGLSAAFIFKLAKISFPKPTMSDIMPLIPVLFIALFELAYFQTYPIFPQYQSADFAQHIGVATNYANGIIPGIGSQLLYYGVEYLLSLGLLLGGLPLVATRYEMGILVALSPLWFYLGAFKLSKNHRIAWITSLVYALTGSWFAMVFISGLYANFYGWLASLFLIAASMDFLTKKVGIARLILLSLALVNALLSHFSILIIMVLLAIYALVQSKKEGVFQRGLLLSALLLSPIAVALALFQSIVGTLFGFLSGGANFQGGTWLSQQIPIPSVSYMVAEINNDWLTALLIGPVLTIFIILAIRKPSSERLFMLAWFLVPLGTVAFAPISWRFSFVALTPLILMVGCVLGYKIRDLPRDWFRRSLWAPTLLIIFIFLIPSPSLSAFQGNQAEVQAADYQAMQWLANNYNGTRSALVLTDWHFIYSQDFKGPPVAYAPNAHVLWYDPTNAYFAAINHSATYIVWTKNIEGIPGYGIFIPKCQKPFDILLTTNTTRTQTNRTIAFDITSTPKLDLQGYLAVANNTIPIGLSNGTGKIELSFNESGNYTIFAQFRNVVTDSFNLNIGNNISYQKGSISVPDDYCLPWKLFNNLSLPGGHLVFQNANVKIWCIIVPCITITIPSQTSFYSTPITTTKTHSSVNPVHRYNLPNAYGIDINGTVNEKSINLTEGESLSFHVDNGTTVTVYFPSSIFASSVTLNGSPVKFEFIIGVHPSVKFLVIEGDVRLEFVPAP